MWKLEPSLLLMPNIPLPLHGVNPRTLLGRKWWDAVRQEAYASTDYHCKACGVPKVKAKPRPLLEAHEVYTINYAVGRAVYNRTVPLCNYCHSYIHDGRLNMLLQTGTIGHHRYVSVLKHGDSVLAEHGLTKKTKEQRDEEVFQLMAEGKIACWEDWRLVIDGKSYGPTDRPDEFRHGNQWS